jgi:hypothetical protein
MKHIIIYIRCRYGCGYYLQLYLRLEFIESVQTLKGQYQNNLEDYTND